MPLTIKVARTQERDRLQLAVLAAQKALVFADNDLNAAIADAASATKGLAALQASESSIRQQLAVAQMPGLIDQLEAELETNLTSQRPQRFTLSEAQDRAALHQCTRQRTAATLDRLRAQLIQADADITLATRDDEQARQWRETLTQKIPSVVAQAKGMEGRENSALSRVTAILGGKQELVDLLAARYADGAGEQTDRRERLRVAIDIVNAVQRTTGPGGVVAATAETYIHTRDQIREIAEDSEIRLAWIESTYRSAVAMGNLPPGEQKRIDTRAVAATSGKESPAKLLAELHTARAQQRDAQTAFDKVARPTKAVNDAFDPATDGSVKDQRGAASTAADKLAKAKDAWKPDTMKEPIDAWEVAVPPAVMQLASDVLRAKAMRTHIVDIDVTNVIKAFDTHEKVYAEALAAEIESRVATEERNTEVLTRMDEVTVLAAVADQRVAALVRGDE